MPAGATVQHLPVPAERTEETPAAADLAKDLAAGGIDGIALTWVDNAGITRMKGIPVSRLESAAARGVGMSPVFDVFVVDDSITSSDYSTGPVGDLRLYPDLRRLRPLAAQPGWAWAPVDRRTQAGDVHPQCSRSFAARMTEQAAAAGLEAQMAFEIEWVAAHGAGAADGIDPATRAPAYGMSRVVELSDYLRDILRALAGEGIQVEQLHPEYAPGQFEVSVAPNTPVGAADDSVLVRQTIRAVGRSHGLRTTFSPSVVAGAVGNGGHVHFSLWRDGRNLCAGGDGPRGLEHEAESFAGGILRELPALLAIGAPSVASYERLVPHHWAGAFRSWGHENREAALRLVTGTAGHEARCANFEVKSFDLSANPYLLVGAVLAAGLAGIRDDAALPSEITVDPGDLSDDELAASGADRLPERLADAVSQFEASTVLAEALGEALHGTLIAVRRAEIDRFAGATPEEVVERTRWRH